MGRGLLPGRKPGPQHTGDPSPGRVVWEDATEPRMPSLRHQAVPGCCPGAQVGDRDGVLVAGYAAGALAGKGVAEEVSSCTLSGRVSKRSTGSLQRLNSPKFPSKWNYSMNL